MKGAVHKSETWSGCKVLYSFQTCGCIKININIKPLVTVFSEQINIKNGIK